MNHHYFQQHLICLAVLCNSQKYLYIQFGLTQFLLKRAQFNIEMRSTFQFQTRNVLFLLIVLIFSIAILTFPFLFLVEDGNEFYKPVAKERNVSEFNGISSIENSVGDAGRCYKSPKSVQDKSQRFIQYLDDILDGRTQPTPGKTIFFHETTCSNTSIININAK